jgi:hypothetical protein
MEVFFNHALVLMALRSAASLSMLLFAHSGLRLRYKLFLQQDWRYFRTAPRPRPNLTVSAPSQKIPLPALHLIALPHDIIDHIVEYMTYADLFSLEQTSAQVHQLLNVDCRPGFWRTCLMTTAERINNSELSVLHMAGLLRVSNRINCIKGRPGQIYFWDRHTAEVVVFDWSHPHQSRDRDCCNFVETLQDFCRSDHQMLWQIMDLANSVNSERALLLYFLRHIEHDPQGASAAFRRFLYELHIFPFKPMAHCESEARWLLQEGHFNVQRALLIARGVGHDAFLRCECKRAARTTVRLLAVCLFLAHGDPRRVELFRLCFDHPWLTLLLLLYPPLVLKCAGWTWRTLGNQANVQIQTSDRGRQLLHLAGVSALPLVAASCLLGQFVVAWQKHAELLPWHRKTLTACSVAVALLCDRNTQPPIKCDQSVPELAGLDWMLSQMPSFARNLLFQLLSFLFPRSLSIGMWMVSWLLIV